MVSAFDLPLVQAGMHGLYTGHITHGTRFGMKYYAKNVVPVFCVSCASVLQSCRRPLIEAFFVIVKLRVIFGNHRFRL